MATATIILDNSGWAYGIRQGADMLAQGLETVEDAQAWADDRGILVTVDLATRRIEWQLVPAYRQDAIQFLIGEINKKARKLGIGGADLRFGQPEEREVSIRAPDGNGYRKAKRMCVTLTGFVAVPRIAGWRVAAVLDHTLRTADEPNNLLGSVDRTFALPEKFRTVAGLCEHCGMNRRRSKTVVLVGAAGDTKQVGLSCLKDYTGSDPTGALASLASFDSLSRCQDADWDDEAGFARCQERAWDVHEFLLVAAAVIRVDGFFSRAKAEDQNCAATVDTVLDAFRALRKEGPAGKTACMYYPAESGSEIEALHARDAAVVDVALAWGRDLQADGSYEHNLRVACRAHKVIPKTAGLLTSLIPAYQRMLARAAEALEKAKHPEAAPPVIGKEGERLEIDVQLLGVSSFEGTFGPTTIYKFATPEGARLVTFASGRGLYVADDKGDREAIVGDNVRIRGTVKGFSEFRGVTETQLSRVAIAPPAKVKKIRKAA